MATHEYEKIITLDVLSTFKDEAEVVGTVDQSGLPTSWATGAFQPAMSAITNAEIDAITAS